MAKRLKVATAFRVNAGPEGAKAYVQDEQWTSPVMHVTNYDGTLSDYLSVYRSQPAVRQVVSFIAENAAQVPLKVYQRVSDTERKTLNEHRLARMLNWPNPGMSRYEFMRDLVTDLEVFDCSFWHIVTQNGDDYAFRMFPDAVELRDFGAYGPKTFRYYKSDGSYDDLSRDQVLYFKGYGSARGISPLETLRRVLAEDRAAGEYREGMYRNGMRNAGVIERPIDAPEWSDKGRDRFLASIRDRHTGTAGAQYPLLLEEGMTWKSDQVNPRSEEYIAGRQFTTKAVANAYRIFPELLGLEPASYSSISEYNRQLYQNALASRLTFLTEAIERQRLSRQELERDKVYVEFNLEAKLRGSFAERAAIAQIAVGKPYMTVDEYRALENLPPLTDEQRAELTPTPTPGPDPVQGAFDQPAPSEDPGALSRPAPKRKAAEDLERGALARRRKYAGQVQEVLDATFARVVEQQQKSKARSKAERWARELKQDLRPVLESVVVAEGTRKAAQYDAEFDAKQVQHYLDAGAENMGKNLSSTIDENLDAHKDDADALKVALAAVSARVADGQASHLMSFARQEVGRQAGLTQKTWVVTSAKSRHPELDGETVPLGEKFSNGMEYPGQPTADAGNTAGCQCVLDLS